VRQSPKGYLYSTAVVGKLLLKSSWVRYFTSVTCKSNSLLLICYPFFFVTVPLQLLVSAILKVTKPLLVT
jgi:hypothetical protein